MCIELYCSEKFPLWYSFANGPAQFLNTVFGETSVKVMRNVGCLMKNFRKNKRINWQGVEIARKIMRSILVPRNMGLFSWRPSTMLVIVG